MSVKITEMKNCIEKMRECYKINDDETEIRLGSICDCGQGNMVEVATEDKNGTRIHMSRYADELVQSNKFKG